MEREQMRREYKDKQRDKKRKGAVGRGEVRRLREEQIGEGWSAKVCAKKS